MKRILALFLIMLGYVQMAKSQNNYLKQNFNQLYILKYNSEELKTSHLLVSIFDFQTVNRYEKTEAEKIYGPIKQDVVRTIDINPGVKLFTLTQLFDLYHVDKPYRNFPIRIDGQETSDTDDITGTTSYITSINVNQNDNYINIVLNRSVPKNYHGSDKVRVKVLESRPVEIRKQ